MTASVHLGRLSRRRTKSARRAAGRAQRVAVVNAGERRAAVLTLLALVLSLFGLVMVLSASSVSDFHQLDASPFATFGKQVTFFVLGVAGFIVTSRLDPAVFRRLVRPGLGVVIASMIAVLVVGVEVNGSQRWLRLGPVNIQPGEFAKLAFVLFVADLLARRRHLLHRAVAVVNPVMGVLAILAVLLLLQPKMGTVILLTATALTMLFLAGVRLLPLVAWSVALASGGLAMAWASTYQRQRLLSFLSSEADPTGAGWQTIQSKVGIASGGLTGVGLGASRAKWGFLPFAHTDFIFAVVAEEVGFLGALGVVLAFVMFCYLGMVTAMRAADPFHASVAAGITALVMFQAFLNIAMTLGRAPVTGESLPFVSAGGSSLIVMLTGTGLLVSIARRSAH